MSDLGNLIGTVYMRNILLELVHAITHLSPENEDGSHTCKISKNLLQRARQTLAGTESSAVIDATIAQEHQEISPLPWSRNPDWPAPGGKVDPSAILDANGDDVLVCSEWMTAKTTDIDFIVAVVNAFHQKTHTHS